MFDDARLKEALRSRMEAGSHGDPRVYCAACMNEITTVEEWISMQHAREHTFTNPAGYEFTIGCFRRAPGCSGEGPATEAHTWFPGYAWCYALCRKCRIHLGWLYRAGAERDCFHGLILNRLIFGKDISRN